MADSEQDESARRRRADEREADLDRREAALSRRIAVAQAVLDAADERDALAEDRDGRATKRDRDADLLAFVDPTRPDSYGWDTPERRDAALDRVHAQGDRFSAADDRTALTADLDAGSEADPEPDAQGPAVRV